MSKIGMDLDSEVQAEVVSIDSLRLFQDYHWLMLEAFWKPAGELLGESGHHCVEQGFSATGYYNGQAMRDSAIALAEGRSPLGVFRHWQSAEWHLSEVDGHLQVDMVPGGVQVHVRELPGIEYAQNRGIVDGLQRYWTALFNGVVRGYDRDFVGEFEFSPETGSATFTVTCRSSETNEEMPSEFLVPIEDEAALLARTRRTTGLLASLQLYPSRELGGLGASGEEVIRRAGHIFGSVRGARIRATHLAAGTPINLESFMGGGGLQERDPSEAVFVFAEGQYLSQGAWYADCTYCPLAEVWSSDAKDGFRFGAMFDEANHVALYRSYHPGVVVRWDAIKSRGDSLCKFRFTIPELMTSDDPTPEEYNETVGS